MTMTHDYQSIRLLLGTSAKRVAMTILSHLDGGKVSESDLDTLGSLHIQIKPWLDLNDADVQRKFNTFLNRKNSSWGTEMTGPAEALCEAVVSLQSLIGVKGALLDTTLSACSIEKMQEISAGLTTLGSAFRECDGKFTAWQKTVDESTQLSDTIKGLAEEADLLLSRGKIILACQSGFLSAVWKAQGELTNWYKLLIFCCCCCCFLYLAWSSEVTVWVSLNHDRSTSLSPFNQGQSCRLVDRAEQKCWRRCGFRGEAGKEGFGFGLATTIFAGSPFRVESQSSWFCCSNCWRKLSCHNGSTMLLWLESLSLQSSSADGAAVALVGV